MTEQMLTPRELSEWIQVPETTLAQWRYRREGPAFLKLGGLVRYRHSAVEQWLTDCEEGTR